MVDAHGTEGKMGKDSTNIDKWLTRYKQMSKAKLKCSQSRRDHIFTITWLHYHYNYTYL